MPYCSNCGKEIEYSEDNLQKIAFSNTKDFKAQKNIMNYRR